MSSPFAGVVTPNLILTYTAPGAKTRSPVTGNWEFAAGTVTTINCFIPASGITEDADIFYSQGGGDTNQTYIKKAYLVDPMTLPAAVKPPQRLPATMKLPQGDVTGMFELRIRPDSGIGVESIAGQSIEGMFHSGSQAG